MRRWYGLLVGLGVAACTSCAPHAAEPSPTDSADDAVIILPAAQGSQTARGDSPSPKSPWPAIGTQLAGPGYQSGQFPATWSGLDCNLRRNGQGLCEWGIFGIDLYEAALYCERPSTTLDAVLTPPQASAIHLRFSRRLTAAQLREAFTAAAKVNAGAELPRYEASLQRLLDAMQDVAKGDFYSFYCLPSQGMLIARNDEALQVIPEDAFRELFLRLYLGDQPPTKPLRDGLLGQQ